LPATIGFAAHRRCSRCEPGLLDVSGLSHGAYEALATHGSDALKKLYLPSYRRHLSGTMC